MDTFDCSCDYRNSGNMPCGDMCCKEMKTLPRSVAVAMAYIPFQQWDEVYSADKGLSVGTMFPCLNLPFVGCSK